VLKFSASRIEIQHINPRNPRRRLIAMGKLSEKVSQAVEISGDMRTKENRGDFHETGTWLAYRHMTMKWIEWDASAVVLRQFRCFMQIPR